MLEAMLRRPYQIWLVDPIAHRLTQAITPQALTLLSGIVGVGIIPALHYQQKELAIFLLLTSGYLDTLDGTLARMTQTVSKLGAVLDILVDRSVEIAVILGLWLYHPAGRALLCILILGSILLCVTSFLIVSMFTPNHTSKSFYYSPGLIERAEAFIFFMLMIVFPDGFLILSSIFIILVCITTFIRIYDFAHDEYCHKKPYAD